MINGIIDTLVQPDGGKIVLVVADGLGGCPMEEGGPTELMAARTPNLDRLASVSSCGILDPVYPGVTPGSGPAHLGLFGYDPVAFNIGRGILSALGVNFPLVGGDVAARVNFATVGTDGLLTDRRAGRISSEENRALCEKLRREVRLGGGVEWFLETEKEHRGVLVLRGENLDAAVSDTDPQKEGLAPLPPRALRPDAERTAGLVAEFVAQAAETLAGEPRANMVILRGFAARGHFPTMQERFGLRSLALAVYPMYKGLARLVGMEVREGPETLADTVTALEEGYADADFFFLHYKNPDSRGEDADFQGKVRAIEELDAVMPKIEALAPDVLAVTGDHSTPAVLGSHSWHPVPVLLKSRYAPADRVESFDELSCAAGLLGRMRTVELMGLMLACARRLKKFGA